MRPPALGDGALPGPEVLLLPLALAGLGDRLLQLPGQQRATRVQAPDPDALLAPRDLLRAGRQLPLVHLCQSKDLVGYCLAFITSEIALSKQQACRHSCKATSKT